jgi:glycosyltransferase involved in cell wall biosynthesis
MHVCIITSAALPPEEGIGNYVYGLSIKMIEKGHRVTIITRGTWNNTQRETMNGIEVIKARFAPCYPFHVHIHGVFVNRLFKSLEESFDIVHIHTPLSPIIETSLPIITTVHTPMKTDARSVQIVSIQALAGKVLARTVSYPLEQRLFKKSKKIVAVASSVAQELKEYGINPHEVMVVGNGVNEEIFKPKQNIIQDGTHDRFILFTGRLGLRKGLFDLIECGRIICKKYPDISFVIPGKGHLSDKLQKRVKDIGLQDRFKFLGFVDKDKLIQLYQDASIYVLPSHYEGLPTVLLEAMACGCPVVATKVSGNIDVISSNKNGILIPPKSPKEMADAISFLLDNDDVRRKFGAAARRTIEERYTWNVISDKMLKCYESLIEV